MVRELQRKDLKRYTLVGCSRCDEVWVVRGVPETTSCRDCGKQYKLDKLRKFGTFDELDRAREGRKKALEALEATAGQQDSLIKSGFEDSVNTFDVDVDEFEEERKRNQSKTEKSMNEREAIQFAVDEAEPPTLENIVSVAEEKKDVDSEKVEKVLRRMQERGLVIVVGGEYKRV